MSNQHRPYRPSGPKEEKAIAIACRSMTTLIPDLQFTVDEMDQCFVGELPPLMFHFIVRRNGIEYDGHFILNGHIRDELHFAGDMVDLYKAMCREVVVDLFTKMFDACSREDG